MLLRRPWGVVLVVVQASPPRIDWRAIRSTGEEKVASCLPPDRACAFIRDSRQWFDWVFGDDLEPVVVAAADRLDALANRRHTRVNAPARLVGTRVLRRRARSHGGEV